MFTTPRPHPSKAAAAALLACLLGLAPAASAIEVGVRQTNQEQNKAANLKVNELATNMEDKIKELQDLIGKMSSCQDQGGAYNTKQDACYPFEIIRTQKSATRGSFNTVAKPRPVQAPDDLEMDLRGLINDGIETVDVTIVPGGGYKMAPHKVTLDLQSSEVQTGTYVTNAISHSRYGYINYTFNPKNGWFRYYLNYTLADGGANAYIDRIVFRWQEIRLRRSPTPM